MLSIRTDASVGGLLASRNFANASETRNDSRVENGTHAVGLCEIGTVALFRSRELQMRMRRDRLAIDESFSERSVCRRSPSHPNYVFMGASLLHGFRPGSLTVARGSTAQSMA
ncbi:hypothetical protein EXIGLDRAFT_719973 [Exidia glandulosa HHB12029]|uniref:Uncharacterized protein n=1 Tax=Exidia glandulosa HHB12029 TaxID=1314781 RepID=A0A165NL37_EXIGL|nr:hypothetical protein EXIGLDRAFT_719973 [Exidia glandulosa HHB12029]